jgi:hypothetical protein
MFALLIFILFFLFTFFLAFFAGGDNTITFLEQLSQINQYPDFSQLIGEMFLYLIE